ncbi:hypothetical protein [Paraburkholderia sp. A3RO-2L]|jgi:hypothetical protein|uniref:hypothetical protein n=1 Tax=Paraburkholderia sp. A3RO-2L TaxID=3028376 RepID=UPI003DA868ED
MKIQVVTYSTPSFREGCVHDLLGQLHAQGITAQLVHPSITSARKLTESMGMPVMSMHDLGFTPVAADCIVVIDGDIIGHQAAKRLEKNDKDSYFIVPADALPSVPEVNVVADLLKTVQSTEFDEPPRTFGCHHTAETCLLCEGLVITWKADRRDKAAGLAEN